MHGLTRPGLVASLIVAGTLTLTTTAWAQDDPDDRVGATECCLPLLLPIGARAVGLGNALTAAGGADALFVNPAGLASLFRDEFRVHNAPTDVYTSNTFGVAFGIGGAGNVAINYRLLDYGEIPSTDENAQETGRVRYIEHVLLASFATFLGRGVAAGVSYKVFQLRQSCSGFCQETPYAATTHGIDVGVQYHPPEWKALQLGASVTHLGLPLQVINAEQSSPTPGRVRAGAAYEVLHHLSADSTIAGWLMTDVVASWRPDIRPVFGAGAEVIMDNTIFVRAGYATGGGEHAGAGVGVGLRYDRFDIGIARSFVGAGAIDQDPFQITFSISF